MKRSIVVTTIALALACAAGASSAQHASRTTSLQHVTVTAAPGQYETYTVNLDAGFDLKALVGNTHRQYMEAQRAAERSEALRKQGLAPSPFVAVAIDNSAGLGVAKRFLLLDGNRDTIAIVEAHCRQAAPEEGERCQLISLPVASSAHEQSLASRDVAQLHLAEVARH